LQYQPCLTAEMTLMRASGSVHHRTCLTELLHSVTVWELQVMCTNCNHSGTENIQHAPTQKLITFNLRFGPYECSSITGSIFSSIRPLFHWSSSMYICKIKNRQYLLHAIVPFDHESLIRKKNLCITPMESERKCSYALTMPALQYDSADAGGGAV
jgi:hypothetical protein